MLKTWNFTQKVNIWYLVFCSIFIHIDRWMSWFTLLCIETENFHTKVNIWYLVICPIFIHVDRWMSWFALLCIETENFHTKVNIWYLVSAKPFGNIAREYWIYVENLKLYTESKYLISGFLPNFHTCR